MVPPKVDNLLVAGRCVAGDKTSHAAMRNMMACTVSGQGAGVAAAVSVQTGKSTHSNTSNRVPQRFQFKHFTVVAIGKVTSAVL